MKYANCVDPDPIRILEDGDSELGATLLVLVFLVLFLLPPNLPTMRLLLEFSFLHIFIRERVDGGWELNPLLNFQPPLSAFHIFSPSRRLSSRPVSVSSHKQFYTTKMHFLLESSKISHTPPC